MRHSVNYINSLQMIILQYTMRFLEIQLITQRRFYWSRLLLGGYLRQYV